MSQWGPNATTWLLPSELFPTEIRAFAHGVSAAAGKLGALAAGLAFSHMTKPEIFWISGVCGIAGVIVTVLFVPDVTTLDLIEIDKKWALTKVGRDSEYKGAAVDPQYLSLWERCWLRRCRPAPASAAASKS